MKTSVAATVHVEMVGSPFEEEGDNSCVFLDGHPRERCPVSTVLGVDAGTIIERASHQLRLPIGRGLVHSGPTWESALSRASVLGRAPRILQSNDEKP
jgi:hypothetical protein